MVPTSSDMEPVGVKYANVGVIVALRDTSRLGYALPAQGVTSAAVAILLSLLLLPFI
jgi:hypothetical protein